MQDYLIHQRFLQTAIFNSKLPQVIIFEGENKDTLKEMAFWFIDRLNNGFKNYKEDIIWLENKDEEIKIVSIRDLQNKLCLKKQFSLHRAVVVENAENLNQEAQSCFLKTLEEPPENTVFILMTTNKNLLLKTIVSRAWILKFIENKLAREQMQAEKCEFLEKSLPQRLKFIEETAKTRQGNQGLSIMKSLVLVLRREIFQNEQARNKIKLIENMRNLMLASNTNKKFIMENIAFNI